MAHWMGASKRAARQAARNRKELWVKSSTLASRACLKSSANIRETSSTKRGSGEKAVISKLRRNERLSRLAVPTAASRSSINITF